MKLGMTIHHNGPVMNLIGRPHTECWRRWQGIKDYHTNPEPVGKGWSDIAYSFGACPHGERMPGRGWDKNQFANGEDIVGEEDGDDILWYSVMVMIGWNNKTGYEEQPTPQMEACVQALIDEGRDTGKCGLRVTPHNFWKPKKCPGTRFTRLAHLWDNRPFTAPSNPLITEDDDMIIYDCPGKPALLFSAGCQQAINTDKRNFLRSQGVPAKRITPDEHDVVRTFPGAG